MTDAAFDPRELTSAASLNHVVLCSMAVPGVQGWLAQDACSRDALHILATNLGLADLRHDHLADDLATALASPDPKTAQPAAATLHTFGLRLGALIATLRDPRTSVRQADSPYRRAFLKHWLTVDSIWLAGGLLAGRYGPHVINGMNAVVSLIPQPCRIGVLREPGFAPLIGAARHGDPETTREAVAVADLGHTRIKTAIAERRAAGLIGLHRIDVYQAPRTPSADEVEDAVAAALIPTVKEAAAAGTARVRLIVSVASFVQSGMPIDDGQGVYGCLAERTPALLRRIEAATGICANLQYLHDGTAAASAATAVNSATITAGTWLGVGFLPMNGPPLLGIGHQPLLAEAPGNAKASLTSSDGGV